MSWTEIEGYRYPEGWGAGFDAGEQSRRACSDLEAGRVLFYAGIPFDLPDADREFLLSTRLSDARYHKNISYRPLQDELRGFTSDQRDDVERLHAFMRRYSEQITRFTAEILAPYAPHWAFDYASYRPLEEQGRDLSLHKRNDLLHVDAFPSRPTHGGRILRVFTNISPAQPRIWLTGPHFPELAGQYAGSAGLAAVAASGGSGDGILSGLKRAVGLKEPRRSAYDRFMLRFHDYLKENGDFQASAEKMRHEFPPDSTWMVFTDSVPHAALSGRFALEQTYIVPVDALLDPERSPLRVLESLSGRPMAAG